VNDVRLDPRGYFRRIPLTPHEMRDRRTRTQDVIVLCHLGVPRLDRETWTLTVDGLVARPLVVRFDDLLRYPKAEVTSFHQCAGSPLQPFEPTRRVCNITWAGVRLADILAACGPTPSARYVWSYGADYGEFSGDTVDAYIKDLPIDRMSSDVLIAYEMNGASLAPEHGFPARLVVPGFYGTNSVKWLTRMTLSEARAQGPFTTRWYNDPIRDEAGRETGKTRPVWAIAPESVIVAPAPDAVLAAGVKTDIWGWAWADGGVRGLDVSVDGGTIWFPAQLEAARGREWQRFSYTWTPSERGGVVLASRAATANGEVQPTSGQRNAIYEVPVSVA